MRQPASEPFLDANRDELAADVCVISDTDMLGVDRPAITYMLRGMAYAEVTLHGPATTSTRAAYGGGGGQPDQRPLPHRWRSCTMIKAGCRSPGFYDDVREIAAGGGAAWRGSGSTRRRSWPAPGSIDLDRRGRA